MVEIDKLLSALRAAKWNERDPIKAELLARATGPEGAGVRDEDTPHPFRLPAGDAEPDRAAPVMHPEVEMPQTQVRDERLDVGDAVGQAQEAVRARGQTHADVVGGDDPSTLGGELQDQVAPEKGPRRIAMQEQDRTTVARPVVDVAHAARERGEIAGCEGIERLHGGREDSGGHWHSTASIMLARPLPIPSNATRSPGWMRPSARPSASVAGTETEPTLPSRSKLW